MDDQQTAEDVVQDAFTGVYRAYSDIADPAKALSYLRSAVLNNARDRHSWWAYRLRHGRS